VIIGLEWGPMALVGSAVVGLLTALSAYQQRYHPHPEWIRKLMHVGSGLIALSLPWLFSDPLSVAVLTVIAAGGMAAAKYWSALRRFGAVTGSVLRHTLGEICFPLGAGVVFLLSQGDPLLFSIPLLILTFADASAALIGIFYGMFHYTTSDGSKTLEGSVAFFITAFLCTTIPLQLFTTLPGSTVLLISLLMALLSMLLDAVAWWGIDNFLIPVLSFVLLNTYMTLELPSLLIQLMLTVTLMIFVIYWRTRTTLNDSAILATVIYGYVCWTLGGWAWIFPPLLFLLSYNGVPRGNVPAEERFPTVPIVLGVGAAGLFWLITANLTELDHLYYPFVLSFATQLAMSRFGVYLYRTALRLLLPRFLLICLLSWLVLFLPFIYWFAPSHFRGPQLLAGFASILFGAGLFMFSQLDPEGYSNTPNRWLLQTLSSTVASFAGFALIQAL
jgi:phytol kinase